MKWVVAALTLLLAVGAIALVYLPSPTAPGTEPATFAECIRIYPVQNTEPRSCINGLGQTFVENTGNAATLAQVIVLASPVPNTAVSSPLGLTGKARGNWYFEGSFPVELRNSSGRVIAEGFAEAQSAWTTPEFVPFKATLTFAAPSFGSAGTLILRKDNPSGLPERDDELVVPIVFR